MMHFAKVAESPRLQRMLAFLRSRGQDGATGREIVVNCEVLNPATYCSELRRNGFNVECSHERTNDNGARVYRYRLIEQAKTDLFE